MPHVRAKNHLMTILPPKFLTKEINPGNEVFTVSKFKNIGDLKNKESNRLLESKKILAQAGIKCKITKDTMVIYGKDKIETRNKSILTEAKGDHRICMSVFVMSQIFK